MTPLNRYIVERPDDHDVAPEETLADSLSGHSVVEIPIGRSVFRLFYLCVAVLFALLAVQSFQLQVVRGGHFAALADQSRLNRYPVPALRGIMYDRTGVPLVHNIPIFDLVAVRSELTAGDPLRASARDQAIFTVRRDISKEEAIRIQAERHPGLYVVAYARRGYPYGPAFAHLLGYTAQISPEELAADTDNRYQHNDRIGRLGLEASYESTLHGALQSVVLDDSGAVPAAPGHDLRLNVDVNIQEHLYEAVQNVFQSSGVVRGAAVIQDVHTGAILGMVSMPAFDPNVFERGGDGQGRDEVAAILSNKNKPLFNRAISGLYPPGSTIKPLYALAGLQDHVVDPSTLVYAEGSISVQSAVDPAIQYMFRDWKVHGWTDIRKAIADSVDVYFYALGGGYGDIRGLGIDRIEKYLKLFGADQKIDIDLPGEARGFVPSKAWKKAKKGEAWYVGDTYNISIGQGDLLVTPLWLNAYVSAIANGGTIYEPQIVTQEPRTLAIAQFDDAIWQVVREGMRQTITDGTGQLLKDLPRAVAAKTGTAQIGEGTALNSLFTVYGPYENPNISMTVLVENIPKSQSLAMRVAKDFLMWYFSQ